MSKELLSPLTVARLQAHEFSQFIGRTLKEIDSEPLSVDDKHVNKFILQLRQTQPVFQKSLDKVKTSAMTEKIAQADLYRDQDLQALFDFIKPYKNSRIADEKDAYTSLAQLFKTYKNTKTTNYEAETN